MKAPPVRGHPSKGWETERQGKAGEQEETSKHRAGMESLSEVAGCDSPWCPAGRPGYSTRAAKGTGMNRASLTVMSVQPCAKASGPEAEEHSLEIRGPLSWDRVVRLWR